MPYMEIDEFGKKRLVLSRVSSNKKCKCCREEIFLGKNWSSVSGKCSSCLRYWQYVNGILDQEPKPTFVSVSEICGIEEKDSEAFLCGRGLKWNEMERLEQEFQDLKEGKNHERARAISTKNRRRN